VIQQGLQERNTKPFWRYVKARKQDNIGISPIRKGGKLLCDGLSKAEALIDQFSSVFTRDNQTETPELEKSSHEIKHIEINTPGVLKLLKKIKMPAKQQDLTNCQTGY